MNKDIFTYVFGANPDSDEIISTFDEFNEKYEINTNQRIAMFFAQLGHESGMFKSRVENLNYSREGLLKTWPLRFNSSNVDAYARNPEKIANKVYANRLGNGPEESGDGWTYRGQGYIQVTGKSNIFKCIRDTGLEHPEDLMTVRGALVSGFWFWDNNKLNRFSDGGDVLGCTKAVNGGTLGLDQRTKLYESLLLKLKE